METDFHKQALLSHFEPFIESEDIYFLYIPCVASPLNTEKYTLFYFSVCKLEPVSGEENQNKKICQWS